MPRKKSRRPAGPAAASRQRRKPIAKRTRRTGDDVMNRIVQAARAEFKRAGFAGTTTATIARNAEVTEAQLFRYFGSKSNLFRETIFKLLDERLMDFTNRHMADFSQAAQYSEAAHLYTSDLQSFISENAAMLTSLVVAQTYDRDNAHGVGEVNSLRTYFDHGASLMAARIKAGRKGKAKVDPKLMVRVSFAAVLACVMFKDWIFPRGLATDEEIHAAINDFVLEGISANF